MSKTYTVTGGAGFIGSNFIRYTLDREPDSKVINVDALTYAGVKQTVDELEQYSGHSFVLGNICDAGLMDRVTAEADVVVNFAAESHVDRSIDSPATFLDANVVGTATLLEAARKNRVKQFVQVSTDEVYGSITEGFAAEDWPLNPSSPYAASKTAADLWVKAYGTTFGYETLITRCTNNFGSYQFPEKVIPLFVTNLMDSKKVPLYGTGLNERDWLHVEDHCSAIHTVIERGTPGEIYNVGADEQVTNVELTHRILNVFGLDDSWIEPVADRPGHDLRYAVDSSKIRALGWVPQNSLDNRLEETVDWYRERRDWWGPLKGAR